MPNYNYNYPQYQPQYQGQYYPQMQNPSQQTQNGGFVSVPNENAVYSYPVAMGNVVTFKIEGKPIVMEKAMGFSQFEAPKIKRFRLVEEDVERPKEESVDLSDMEKVKSDIREIWGKLDEIENSRKKNQSQPQPKADRSGEH